MAASGAILQYARVGGKEKSLTLDVRNRLLDMGWKVQCSQDTAPLRYCYMSPSGKTYYSLKKLCQDLASNSLISEHSHLLDSSQHNDGGLLLGEQAKEGKTKIPIQDSVSEADVLVVESEYCPQAVIDWYTITGQEDYMSEVTKTSLSNLSLKAKKHLSALGWTFWFADKKGRQELRYKSPHSGKNYYSLRMACKSCIEESKIEFPSSTIPSSAETGSVQTSMKKSRGGRKRKGEPLGDEFSSIGGERGMYPRSSKRVRTAVTSDSIQRNPRTAISWLIDRKVVLAGAEVHCRNKSEVVKKGKIFGNGIKCDCCCEVFTLSRFEVHAGSTKHRPAANIFLEDGRSLLDCQKVALRNIGERSLNSQYRRRGLMKDQVENDNICSVCQYGGEIILCDGCPSSFHQSCLGLSQLPNGDWFCPSCCCKICSQSRYKQDSDDCVDNRVLFCDQCERKYHTGCLKSRGCTKLKNHPSENWFCGGDCENIFLGLKNLLGKPFSVGVDNMTWTLLKTRGTENSEADTCEIERKLNIALEVMHECFEPLIEVHSGRDLVEDVIFSKGSELNRLNFRGFYTAILERNDEVISVATVRIYGKEVAEVPLIATRFQFRRLGMCRILMNELEKKLNELRIDRMVLPAVHHVLSTWTNSFGFARMTDSERSQFLDYTFLDFQGTFMCQKLLKKPTMESGAVWPKPGLDLQHNQLISCITETCY